MTFYCELNSASTLPTPDSSQQQLTNFRHINQSKTCYVFFYFYLALEDDIHIFLVLEAELFSLLTTPKSSLIPIYYEGTLNRACRKSLKPLQKKTLTGLNAPGVQAYELKSLQSLVQHHFRNVPKS